MKAKPSVAAKDRRAFARFLAQLTTAATSDDLLRLRERLNVLVATDTHSVSTETLETILGMLQHRTQVLELRSRFPVRILERLGYPRELDHTPRLIKEAYQTWFGFYVGLTLPQLTELLKAHEETLRLLGAMERPIVVMSIISETTQLRDTLAGQKMAITDAHEIQRYRQQFGAGTHAHLRHEDDQLAKLTQRRDVRLRRWAIAYLILEETEVIPLIERGLP